MVVIAPRYDRRIDDLIRELDDRSQPIAETCRRVGRAAVELGLYRPSSTHLRRLISAEREQREQRDATRKIAGDVVLRVAYGLPVHAYEVSERAGSARDGRGRDAP